MKKAFTLIEMVIVLVIIGILMGVTMKFSSNRIVDLKAQSLKDAFVDSYALAQSQNLASSYHWKFHYTTMTLTFWNGILAQYDGSGDTQLFSDMEHMKLTNVIWTQVLSLTPYHMGCTLNEWTWVSFNLEVNGNKTYCFSINPNTCTLKELPCWTK